MPASGGTNNRIVLKISVLRIENIKKISMFAVPKANKLFFNSIKQQYHENVSAIYQWFIG
jgi:hypothetical protein